MDLTNGLPEIGRPKEGFRLGKFHTTDYKMWLVERDAPTPSEKEILDSVPFMQGEYDFSTILGERVFDNRTISYTFEIMKRDYTSRKSVQTGIENWLMRGGITALYDDHARDYYYMVKCISVDTVDSYGGLRVNAVFSGYPFKINVLAEGNDIWDSFNFELDIAQTTAFNVNGEANVTLYNVGVPSLPPTIIASSAFTIIKGSQTFMVNPGETNSPLFRLVPGENRLILRGNGRIEFKFFKELI